MRWKIPRESYPMDRKGYLEWRSKLKQFHAAVSSRILLEVGYDSETIRKVSDLILKKNFPSDCDSRVLEDALCLVFLKYQLSSFRLKTDDAKMISILKKSWGKMTEDGRRVALNIKFDQTSKKLIDAALSNDK